MTVDTSYYGRFRSDLLSDPEAKAEYERARAEIAETDNYVNHLLNRIEARRNTLGMPKAELARRIGKNPSSIRRMLTAPVVRPEMSTIVAMAQVLGGHVSVEFPEEPESLRTAAAR